MKYISTAKEQFMEPYVTLSESQHVGCIEFFNPPHNALPSHLLAELTQALNDAAQDKRIRVIVLRSGGNRTFCAGASFNEMVSLSNQEESTSFFMGFANVINAIRNNPKLVIGCVQGKAVGGGVGLAAATDICFASEFASIKLSELGIGIGPFVIEPAVTRKIGVSAMGQLTLKAQTFFSAKWAREKGLFANVFESNEELTKEVDLFANELKSYNSEALSSFKTIQWSGTAHWDALLKERAELSGKLALSPFTKLKLKQYSTKNNKK